MKNLWMLSLVLGSTVAHADLSESVVESIQNQVRECAVQTYSINSYGQKKYHLIKSQCDMVQIQNSNEAVIRVGGALYIAQMNESIYSDGDLFDVTIREARTGEIAQFPNVPAYGDVLLGVLGGYTDGLAEEEI